MSRQAQMGASAAIGRTAELLERLIESSGELRGIAVLTTQGAQLLATNDADWAADTARLWTALDVLGPDAAQVHVATESGEVFAVRDSNGVAVATSDRFALASLVFSDLRAALRVFGGGVG